MTKGKTIEEIDEMILDELGWSHESIREWERLISLLSGMKIGNRIEYSEEFSRI